MGKENGKDLTEDEFRLYDRQIRLWGLGTQRRIRACAVLLYGLSGFGAEVAKNLMLAGVKSLTLMDNDVVTEADLRANFFLGGEDVGKNRATASLARCQELNTGVVVSAVASSVEELTASVCGQFGFVCLFDQTFETTARIDQECRKVKVRFCAGNSAGFFGCAFFDFLEQPYRITKSLSDEYQSVFSDDDVANPSTSSSAVSSAFAASGDNPAVVSEVAQVKSECGAVEVFQPLDHAMDVQWTSEKVPRTGRRKKMLSDAFFVFQLLFRFASKRGSFPDAAEPKDIAQLKQLCDQLAAEFGKCASKCVIAADLGENVFGQLSPVCAILGGFLSSQVINAISEEEQPYNNAIFYDGFENSCQLLKLPLTLQCKPSTSST